MQLHKTSTPVSRRLHPKTRAVVFAAAFGLVGLVSTSLAADITGSDASASAELEKAEQTMAHILQWYRDHPETEQQDADEAAATSSTRNVTNCNSSGAGSLPRIVFQAQEGDIVSMAGLSCSPIKLDNSLYIAQNDLTLLGDGSGNIPMPMITRSTSNTSDRLVLHVGGGTLKLSNIYLTGARLTVDGDAKGGCVKSYGNVYLRGSWVYNCIAKTTTTNGYALGGGIFAQGNIDLHSSWVGNNNAWAQTGPALGGGLYSAEGDIKVVSSKVSGNTAQVLTSDTGQSIGGAIYVGAGQDLTVERSTIDHNQADYGSAIFTQSTSVVSGGKYVIDTSTITDNKGAYFGNSDPDSGAAIVIRGLNVDLLIQNSTITNNTNTTYATAGLRIEGGTPTSLVLKSNIISNNSGDGYPFDYENGTGFEVQGSHNLIGWVDAGLSIMPPDAIRQENAPMEPLQDNGGPTSTRMPATGNWAFNHGWSDRYLCGINPIRYCYRPDQRGMDRKVGAGVDIGAVESDTLFIGRFEDPPTFFTR